MSRTPTLSVIIPVRDQHELLERCIQAVLTALDFFAGGWELILVDDASREDPRRRIPAGVRVLKNSSRLGFGPSANRGVESARGEFCCLLNSDMEVDADFFAGCLDSFSRPTVLAICGAIEEPDGTDAGLKWLRMGDFGPTFHFSRVGESREPRPVPYANGGGSLFRRSLFLELGGFDDLFLPYYWEDADLGFRGWKRGLESHYWPSLRLQHRRGASTGSDGVSRVKRIKQRNRHLFHWVNFTDTSLLEILRGCLLTEATGHLRRGRLRRLAWLLADCSLLTRVVPLRERRRVDAIYSDRLVLDRLMGAA